MALRKKTLAIPLTGPLERRNGGEDLTANLTALPAIPRALNVYRSRTGEWKQRPGHTLVALPSNATGIVGGCDIGGQARLLTRHGQFCKSDASDQFSQTEDAQTFALGARSRIRFGAFADKYSNTESEQVSAAAGGGVVLAAARTSVADVTPAESRMTLTSSRVSDGSVIIESSGAVFSFSGGLTRVLVLYSSVLDRFAILFTTPGAPSTAATTLAMYSASPSSILAGLDFASAASTSLATDLIGTATSANAHFDAIVEEDAGTIVVAYRGTGGNTRALRVNPSTFAITTGPVTVVAGGDVAANSLCWMRVAAETFPQVDYRLVTAINAATGIVDRRINKLALTQTSSATVKASPGDVGAVTAFIDYGADVTSGDGRHVFWDVVDAEPGRAAIWDSKITAGTWSSGEMRGAASMRLHGHVFNAFSTADVSAAWALPVCGSVDVSGKLLFSWVDGQGSFGNYLVTALDGKSDFAPIVRGHLNQVASSGGVFYYGAVEWLSRANDPGLASTAESAFSKCAQIIEFRLSGQRVMPVQIDGNTALLPGSAWTKADGLPYSGGHFPYYQSAPLSSLSQVTGTGLLTPGDYYFSTLVVVADSSGRRWTGFPSLPVKGTITGINNQMAYRITDPPSIFSGRSVSVEVYRSKVNGTQQFRTRTFSVTAYPLGSGFLTVDKVADSVLETALPLYTDSGEMLHYSPPPSNIAWVAGGRVLAVDSERPTDVWASSEFTPGEGPWFNPDMRIRIPGGEELVAGAFMDGRSFLFTKKSIFALSGPWPGRTGAGQLPEVQRVATGVGGYSPESTVVTAEGIWFYSEDRGQCLLNRGLAVVPAGKIVDGVITSPPVAAVQVERYDQVRFYLSTGVMVMYDQVERQWSHGQIAPEALGGEQVAGAFIHSRDVYVFTATKLLKEDAAAKDDAGTAFDVGLDARIPIGPPGGKARIYRAILSGLVTSDTKLYCTVFNDFGNVGSDEDAKVMTVKARPGETVPALYEQTIRPKRGRCDSMLLRFAYQSTEGGLTFRALAVEVGGYQPATVARPGASRQA